MKYFIDTEFIEGFKKPISWLPTIGKFNKPYHSIQLISIGIVAEDGRTFYAVSNEFNPDDADEWVKNNVLSKLEADLFQKQSTYAKSYFNLGLKDLIRQYGLSNKNIAERIVDFINSEPVSTIKSSNLVKLTDASKENFRRGFLTPEFYAYYADYDWVVFCSLFGRMIDLPKGFPMYCKDIKQIMDDTVSVFCASEIKSTSFESALARFKRHEKYPKNENEHHALSDAKFDRDLYYFLSNLGIEKSRSTT